MPKVLYFFFVFTQIKEFAIFSIPQSEAMIKQL